ncbi:MAG TPA: DUF6496 domain-containing protein [Terriglobia bacterium]|nr:DUF6496 domain-containing protein [Terriglobia bacterium]
MPASEVMPLFKAHKLHSGSPHGPIVTNPAQAKAIQLSYARKEGADVPPPPDKKKRKRRMRAFAGHKSKRG